MELRAYVEQAGVERRALRIKEVEWQRQPGDSVVDDVTAARKLLDELEHANRRLESAHEELQSTVEELETTNDELQGMNDTLRQRGAELDEVNDFLESILVSVRSGVVVVDQEMRVRRSA